MNARKARLGPSGVSRVSLPWAELVSSGVIGVAIGVALIIGSQHMGQMGPGGEMDGVAKASLVSIAAPISVLHTKEAPLASPLVSQRKVVDDDFVIYTQAVARGGKGDMLTLAALQPEPGVADVDVAGTEDVARPEKTPRPRPAVRILRTPPVWKLEKSWRLARAQRARILAERKRRLRERMCLAKALYFEARGEGPKGQLAVAQVIMNRVRDPRFPNTVCGVVYQGAERRNACQFSFACDGKPDYPSNARQWAVARRLAAKVLSGRARLRGMEGVAFYHADYVRPQWASMMRPVIKIGRHIFYRDS